MLGIIPQNLALMASYSLAFKVPIIHTISDKTEMSSFAGSSCVTKNPKYQT